MKYETNIKMMEVKEMNYLDEIILEHNENENEVKITFKKAKVYTVKLQFKDLQGNEYAIYPRFVITDA